MLLILFGLAGSGKNFVANLLSKKLGSHHWDADELISPEMKKCIQEKKIFTQTMRDNFTQNIIQHMKQLQKQHPNLIVTQALYKEQNRLMVHLAFPRAEFILIKTAPDIIQKRLQKRNNAIDEQYAALLKSEFEEPKLPHQTVFNNEEQAEVISFPRAKL